MHHIFIINPAAGKGRAVNMVGAIESRFKDFIQSFEVLITEASGHATKLANEAASCGGPVRIYSVGGDGTLNEIVNGIVGLPNVELGIIPCGSGNDLARFLYPVNDPFKLIKVLPVSTSKPIDLGKVNGKYFANIASIGFDAEVVLNRQYFKRFPLVSGSMSYILAVLVTLIKCKKYNLKITLDNKSAIEKKFLLTIFANGSYYGGGMLAAPDAKIDDGIVDFYLVESLTRLKILKFFPLFQKGEHTNMKEVDMSRGTKAIVESENPFPVNIDGEISLETRISIDLLPQNIKVLIP